MKIMAIDYGDAHTGIAISDVTGTLAGFTTVIDSRKAEVVVQEILRLLPEHGVTELSLIHISTPSGGRPAAPSAADPDGRYRPPSPPSRIEAAA